MAKAQGAVPTIYPDRRLEMVGTLRFAHPAIPEFAAAYTSRLCAIAA